MSEIDEALVRRVFEEAWNKGNVDIADEIFASAYVLHEPTFGQASGPNGVKGTIARFRDAFPDVRVTIHELLSDGDKVIVRWTREGTHRSEFMGLPPTAKRFSVSGISVVKVASGKIVETWQSWDALGFLQQLGVMPQLPQSGR